MELLLLLSEDLYFVVTVVLFGLEHGLLLFELVALLLYLGVLSGHRGKSGNEVVALVLLSLPSGDSFLDCLQQEGHLIIE